MLPRGVPVGPVLQTRLSERARDGVVNSVKRMAAAICIITPSQTLPLRSKVLRPGLPLEAAIFPGDDDLHTFHLGVWAGNTIVGVASLFQQPPPKSLSIPDAVTATGITTDDADQFWQLKGMAVDPQVQGQGYGRRLLRACVDYISRRSGLILWCNARTSAVEFYLKGGFEVCGDEFFIVGVGPHLVMTRPISNCHLQSTQTNG